MFIQFYGHSICAKRNKKDTVTFFDILNEKYKFQYDEGIGGIACCSEERILYDLKKTKNIDIAIIFHSESAAYFCPTAGRDYIKGDDHDSYSVYRYNDIAISDKSRKTAICQEYDSAEVQLMHKYHEEHFITPDLLKNRFYGAITQIDQYLKYKKIPVIHCITKHQFPSWFSFTHGIVDDEINLMQFKHIVDRRLSNEDHFALARSESGEIMENPYYASYHASDNAITAEGNILIATKLSGYIDSLRG